MYTEVIALIVSYLGVFIGYGLSKIAKEEVKEGQDNLFYLQIMTSFLIVAWMFYNIFPEKQPIVIIDAIITLLVLFFVFLIPKYNYALLGIIFGLNPGFVLGSLIFLYGFPTGSLMYKDNYKKILMKTWPYLVLGLVALLVRNYLLI